MALSEALWTLCLSTEEANAHMRMKKVLYASRLGIVDRFPGGSVYFKETGRTSLQRVEAEVFIEPGERIERQRL